MMVGRAFGYGVLFGFNHKVLAEWQICKDRHCVATIFAAGPTDSGCWICVVTRVSAFINSKIMAARSYPGNVHTVRTV